LPKLHQKVSVLEGNGEVLSYQERPDVFYYRELVEGERRYRSMKIEGVDTLEDAKKKSIDCYTKFRTPVAKIFASVKKRKRTTGIGRAISDYLLESQKRADLDEIKQKTVYKRKLLLNNHVAPYLESKGLQKTQEIKEDTFNDYQHYRKGAKRLTVKVELKEVSCFLNYLKQQRLIASDVAGLKLVPTIKIKKDELLANPAIGPDDWNKIWHYVKDVYLKDAENYPSHRIYHWRKLFYTFIMVAKNSGLRPIELHKLQWKNIELIDLGQRSSTDTRPHIVAEISARDTKTGVPRQVPANCGTQLQEWRIYQRSYNEKWFKSTDYNEDAHVFGNFYNHCRPYSHSGFNRTWKQCVDKLNLKGHWASDEPYTIYSMRSTFVEDHLMRGTPIAELAMMSGHSPQVLLQHYARLDVRRKTRELTELPIGQKREGRKVIDLEFD